MIKLNTGRCKCLVSCSGMARFDDRGFAKLGRIMLKRKFYTLVIALLLVAFSATAASATTTLQLTKLKQPRFKSSAILSVKASTADTVYVNVYSDVARSTAVLDAPYEVRFTAAGTKSATIKGSDLDAANLYYYAIYSVDSSSTIKGNVYYDNVNPEITIGGTPFSTEGSVYGFNFTPDETSYITLKIFNGTKAIGTVVTNQLFAGSVAQVVYWDGKINGKKIPNEDDGYSFKITAKDIAGNSSTTNGTDFTLDRGYGPTLAIVTEVASVTKKAQFKVSIDSDATVFAAVYDVNDTSDPIKWLTDETGTFKKAGTLSFTWNGKPDGSETVVNGTYIIEVGATDAADNTNTNDTLSSAEFIFDAKAPTGTLAASSVTLATYSDSNPYNYFKVDLTGVTDVGSSMVYLTAKLYDSDDKLVATIANNLLIPASSAGSASGFYWDGLKSGSFVGSKAGTGYTIKYWFKDGLGNKTSDTTANENETTTITITDGTDQS